MADRVDRPDVCIGDIIEWQGVPVLVLSDPKPDPARYEGRWVADVAYIRLYPSVSEFVKVGVRREGFNVCEKARWTESLTDEEEALAMRLLLSA